jgi:hypothetical protein
MVEAKQHQPKSTTNDNVLLANSVNKTTKTNAVNIIKTL